MDEPQFDEIAAIRASAKGDRAAFGRLVRAYQRRAYAAAYGFAANREDALDLAQESFARAFRAMPRFKPEMPFYPWLYRIIRNLSLNHLKKKRRHGEQSLDELVEGGFDARDDAMGPGATAELGDLREAIRQAMDRLGPEHREILRLRHFLEMSYSEIAQCLGVPEGTVMSRLHAARKGLRAIVEDQSTPHANKTPAQRY